MYITLTVGMAIKTSTLYPVMHIFIKQAKDMGGEGVIYKSVEMMVSELTQSIAVGGLMGCLCDNRASLTA